MEGKEVFEEKRRSEVKGKKEGRRTNGEKRKKRENKETEGN